jgi:retinol dehydrogenase 12
VLASKGARVYISARSSEKAQTAIAEVQKHAKAGKTLDLEPLIMDLSVLEQVRDAAQVVVRKETRLDILVNNAGR